jgi:hypothetical protein
MQSESQSSLIHGAGCVVLDQCADSAVTGSFGEQKMSIALYSVGYSECVTARLP